MKPFLKIGEVEIEIKIEDAEKIIKATLLTQMGLDGIMAGIPYQLPDNNYLFVKEDL